MNGTNVGSIYYDARINLKGLKQDLLEAETLMKKSTFGMAGPQEKLRGEIDKTNKSILASRAALIAMGAAAAAAGAAVAMNLGTAIDRADTLVNFPKVLTAMGESMEDATQATNTLANRLKGLPTPLQDGASAVQQLIAAGLPVPVATEAFLALNNAFLAGGASATTAAAGMVQLQQALSRGRIEGEEWNSIVGATPTFLKAMILETGKTRDELRELYSQSPEKLIQDMIRLNTEGGGGLASLDEQARATTAGIRTSIDNMNAAITRGITAFISSLGQGETAQERLASGSERIARAIERIGKMFEDAGKSLGNFVSGNGELLIRLGAVAASVAVVSASMRVLRGIYTAASATMATMQSVMTLSTAASNALAAGNVRAATALLALRAAAIRTIASLTIVGTIMAAIGFAAGEALVDMSKVSDEVDDIKNPAIDTKDALEGWQPAIGKASKEAEDLAKKLRKIDEQIKEASEDYRYRLAELVADKNQNIANLRDILKREEQAYNNAYAERLASFNKTQNDEERTHSQKVKELQTQIDFLSRYSNTANQRRLSELQFVLARENSEYQKSTQLREAEFNAQTKSALTEYEARRAENHKKLNEELALLEKHRQDVLSVRNVMLLDEIENLRKSRDERIRSLQEQKNEAISNANEMAGAFGGITKNLTEADKKFQEFLKNVEKGVKTGGLKELYTPSTTGLVFWPKQGGFADGGFTGRGDKNQPAGLVHRGEYVLPKEVVNQSTGQPDWDKIGANMGGQNLTINLSGVFATSKTEQRRVAEQIATRLQEITRAKGFATV